MNFLNFEQELEYRFSQSGPFYHLHTPENFDLIFTSDGDYIHGMSLFGICAKLFPQIKIYTYELMSNHIHVVASGEKSQMTEFFRLFKSLLKRHFGPLDRDIHWEAFTCNLIDILTIDNLQNTIVYVNKNGYVVNQDTTPYNYIWGANRYYFNDEAKKRYIESKKTISKRSIIQLSHSRRFDNISDIYAVDGYISPLCYCHIEEGELFFKDAHQYFYKLSKNLPASKEIANSIGEFIYYTDDDLFSIAVKEAIQKYGSPKLASLPAQAKVEIARMLHKEYNAGNKQIQRLLRIEKALLDDIFPKG